MANRICAVEDCARVRYARGWCRIHYRRVHATGSPDRRQKSATERFWEKVDRTGGDNRCWTWTAGKSAYGYGSFHVGEGKWECAHRFAYVERFGSVPTGMHLDHICRNPSCVNPSHLRVTTCKQNLENRDLNLNNKSGFRGVHWSKSKNRWIVVVRHYRKQYFIGAFTDVNEANAAAVTARNSLFTHNDLDRPWQTHS